MDDINHLKLYSLLFDSTTGLNTLPFHHHTIHQFLERYEELTLFHILASSGREMETRMGWQDYEDLLSRIAALLVGYASKEDQHILALNSTRGDEFTLILPCDRNPDAIYSELKNIFNKSLKGDPCPLIGYNNYRMTSTERWERSFYAAVMAARKEAFAHGKERVLLYRDFIRQFVHAPDFQVHYQPIFDLHDSSILGYESLLRLSEESPFENSELFFTYAEGTEYIKAIENLIWDRAHESFSGTSKALLFFNITPSTLPKCDFLKSADAPSHIVLEITERVKIHDWVEFRKELSQLHERGYRIALDDVGSGYSSLQAILEIKPDYIKIDHSLIHGVESHPIKRNLIVSLLEAARELNANVIAENIESQEELRTLTQLGVRYGQGRYLQEPTLSIAAG